MSNHDLIFQLAKMLSFHYFFRIIHGMWKKWHTYHYFEKVIIWSAYVDPDNRVFYEECYFE